MLAKGHTRKTQLAVRLEPVILRMQIQAFYQLSYPGISGKWGAFPADAARRGKTTPLMPSQTRGIAAVSSRGFLLPRDSYLPE